MKLKEFFMRNKKLLKNSFFIFLIVTITFYIPIYLFYLFKQNPWDLINLEQIKLCLAQLNKWDVEWILGIASKGYPNLNSSTIIITRDYLRYAWPPLYPLILRYLNYIFKNYSLTIFFTQNIFLFCNIFITFKIVKLFFKKNIKFLVLLYFIFPLSIFLHIGYTESLFLLLINLCIYFTLAKKYFCAALFGLFLPLVKYQGALFFFFIDYFLIKEYVKNINFKQIFSFFIINIILVSGIFFWMFTNYRKTNDFNFFTSIQNTNIYINEWHKNENPFTVNFLNLYKISIGKIHIYDTNLKLQGYFVLIYFILTILLVFIKEIKKSTSIFLSIFGIFFLFFPLSIGIESLWRYYFVYIIAFFPFIKIKNKNIQFFLICLFLTIKTAFSIAFLLKLHIT